VATIVLAEDDDDIRFVAARILRGAGYTVIEAGDGAAALQAVRGARPDAVVSDIDMPVMTGVELCQVLRAHDDTKNLPVVLVSGSLQPGDTRPFEAHATAFLSKPFVRRDFVECLEKVLRSGHGQGQEPASCS
jgi:CheY-like chemotaxis protein